MYSSSRSSPPVRPSPRHIPQDRRRRLGAKRALKPRLRTLRRHLRSPLIRREGPGSRLCRCRRPFTCQCPCRLECLTRTGSRASDSATVRLTSSSSNSSSNRCSASRLLCSSLNPVLAAVMSHRAILDMRVRPLRAFSLLPPTQWPSTPLLTSRTSGRRRLRSNNNYYSSNYSSSSNNSACLQQWRQHLQTRISSRLPQRLAISSTALALPAEADWTWRRAASPHRLSLDPTS